MKNGKLQKRLSIKAKKSTKKKFNAFTNSQGITIKELLIALCQKFWVKSK